MSFNALHQQPYSTRIITGGVFWPDISVGAFQRMYRLPQEYAEDLVEDHLALARLWTMRQLDAWRSEQQEAGYAHLDEVPLFGSTGEATRLFLRAVFCHAKGLLLAQFATIERRDAAKNDAKEGTETAAMFFAYAHDAIADITNTGRITVALI